MQHTGETSEMIIVFTPESNIVPDERGLIISLKGKDKSAKEVNNLLQKYRAVIRSIGSKTYGNKPLVNQQQMTFFSVSGSGALEELRQKLLQIDIVDAAYFKPADEDPGMFE